MKCLLVTGIISIASVSSVLADNEFKVKLVCARGVFVNTEYFNPNMSKVEVQPVNATYNLLHYVYDLMKDLPTDTLFRTDVYRSDSGSTNYKWVQGFTVYLCSDHNNIYNQFMPDSLQALRQSEFCGKKMQREINFVDYVKFYNLLTDNQLKNAYFKVINRTRSGNIDLYVEELDFISNCN